MSFLLSREQALGAFCRCCWLAAQISELLAESCSTPRAIVVACLEELYGVLCHEALLRCRGPAFFGADISFGIASESLLSGRFCRPGDRPRRLSASGSSRKGLTLWDKLAGAVSEETKIGPEIIEVSEFLV